VAFDFDCSPGDIVAERYRIEAAIGRGGSATVYRAVDSNSQQPVALKMMHMVIDPTGVERKRFEREARLAQKIRHPHVAALLDFGQTHDNVPFMVLQLLEGCSLKTAIIRDAPLAPTRVGELSLQILDGLAAAHALGIVHRDIKPGNIFLAQHEASERALLLDFGLAKVVEGDISENPRLTKTGYRLGTPRYMSHEQARGVPVDASSDLYSLALVMGEMLTGEPVVSTSAQFEILLVHGQPTPLELSDAVRTSPFGAVIERALSKERHIRYRNAMQMRADLEVATTNATLPAAFQRLRSADLSGTVALNVADVPASSQTVPHSVPAAGSPAVPSSGTPNASAAAVPSSAPVSSLPYSTPSSMPMSAAAASQGFAVTHGSAPPPGKRAARLQLVIGITIIVLLATAAALGGYYLG